MQNAWPAAATALDPRALPYNIGDYRALGFAATAQPNASNASVELTVQLREAGAAAAPTSSSTWRGAHVHEAPQEYILSLYMVDFEEDGCSCQQPPSCCHSGASPPSHPVYL